MSCAERRQHPGWLRRKEENAAILALARQGTSIKEIIRQTGKSRGLVRQVVRSGRTDVVRSRTGSLAPFLKQLDADCTSGCHDGAALWRRVKAAGFAGGLRVVTEWATRRCKEEAAPAGDAGARKLPLARGIARMMTTERALPSKTIARTMAVIEAVVPGLVLARDLMDQFHGMIRRRAGADLEPRIAVATQSLLASFANGIVADRAGLQAALVEWPDRRAEHQVQVGEATDVRPGKAGSPPRAAARRSLIRSRVLHQH